DAGSGRSIVARKASMSAFDGTGEKKWPGSTHMGAALAASDSGSDVGGGGGAGAAGSGGGGVTPGSQLADLAGGVSNGVPLITRRARSTTSWSRRALPVVVSCDSATPQPCTAWTPIPTWESSSSARLELDAGRAAVVVPWRCVRAIHRP